MKDYNKIDYYIKFFSKKPYWERNKKEEKEEYDNESLVFCNDKVGARCIIDYYHYGNPTYSYISGINFCVKDNNGREIYLDGNQLDFFPKAVEAVEDPVNFHINTFSKLSEHLEIFKMNYEPILNDFGYYVSLPNIYVNINDNESDIIPKYFYRAVYCHKDLDNLYVTFNAFENNLYLSSYDLKPLPILTQKPNDFYKEINNFIITELLNRSIIYGKD